MRMTNTSGLLALASLARGRNRSVNENRLALTIDLNGVHLLAGQFIHNDVEWRTLWLVKLEGQTAPVEIWLDIPINGNALDRLTTPVEDNQ